MNIPQDIINELSKLIGLDTSVVKKLFAQYGIKRYRQDKDGFTEDMIALLLGLDRPTSKKGMDFPELAEVKQISCNVINSGALRVKGDTPIANLEKVEFFSSNCWDKVRKILCVLVVNHCPQCNSTNIKRVPKSKTSECECGNTFNDKETVVIITDIRLFDGEKYKSVMENDWNLLHNGQRSKTDMFSLKEKWNNQIQMKRNGCVKLSVSLTNGIDNNIEDQEAYAIELFEEKLSIREEEFRVYGKTFLDKVTTLLNKGDVSINDLEAVEELINKAKEAALGFKDIQTKVLNF